MTPLLALMHDTSVHLHSLKTMSDNFLCDVERLHIMDTILTERIQRMKEKVDKVQEILDVYYVEIKKQH